MAKQTRPKRERYDPEMEKKKQAANRRKLIAGLEDPQARQFLIEEFAKLGLHL
jgi:hypothetical protein